jgi:hypothetical protein
MHWILREESSTFFRLFCAETGSRFTGDPAGTTVDYSGGGLTLSGLPMNILEMAEALTGRRSTLIDLTA